MLENWILGFQAIMSPMPLLMMVVGVLAGIVIGALPGLTAVMGVAVLMPFTFSMDPLTGMMMMCGIYTSTIYAGSIPSILMKVPGTPSSAAAILDGYPMAQQGKGGQALNISLWSSFVGSLVGGNSPSFHCANAGCNCRESWTSGIFYAGYFCAHGHCFTV